MTSTHFQVMKDHHSQVHVSRKVIHNIKIVEEFQTFARLTNTFTVFSPNLVRY